MAQIIHLSAYRCPQKDAPAQRRTGGGLRISTATASVLSRINRGEVVTDLGQIDKTTRRVLKRFLDKGYVYRGTDYNFPKEKTCWAGADFWYIATDDQPEPTMPPNVRFREL